MKIFTSSINSNAKSAKEISLSFSNANTKILSLLWLNNLYDSQALCAGVGKCGKCKVLFHSPAPLPTQDELQILSSEEIDRGIRLSCKHNAKDDYIIELLADLENNSSKEHTKKSSFFFMEEAPDFPLSLAIDFGTTSLEYTLFTNNKTFAHGKMLNPMQGIGAEVMARLEFAKSIQNATALKERTWQTIGNIVKELNDTGNFIIDKIIFSANSAMAYLALGKDIKCLATAPYFLEYTGNSTEFIADIIDFDNAHYNDATKEIVKKIPPIYIPPLLAPFIGGDISSGLLALETKFNTQNNNSIYPYFFIDMGTNAEFVLALSESEGFMASVPLGPSVEGVGLTFGTVANPTSIVDFTLSPFGLQSIYLNEKMKAKKSSGITGVGYLHLLQILLKLALVDKYGHFNIQTSPTEAKKLLPLARKIAHFSEHNSIQCLDLPLGLPDTTQNDSDKQKFYLSSYDIENLLMVKSAFRASFEILLQKSQLPLHAIQNIFIAGAFGEHLKKEILTDLGFLPHSLLSRIAQLGNTSLKGAELLSKNENHTKIQKQFTNYQQIELANQEDFAQIYMKYFNFEKI